MTLKLQVPNRDHPSNRQPQALNPIMQHLISLVRALSGGNAREQPKTLICIPQNKRQTSVKVTHLDDDWSIVSHIRLSSW